MASSGSIAPRFAKAALVSVVLMAPLGFLNSEPVHDALARWFGVAGGGDLVVRYEYSSHQLALLLQMAWLLFATFLVFWSVARSRPNVESPARFALLLVMLEALLLSPFMAYGPLTEIVAIEVTRAGNIDLLSRTGRESFPVTALVRLEGSTSEGSMGYPVIADRTRHSLDLAFADGQGKEVVREVEVWGRWDNSLTTLVARLEALNPRVDAKKFWSWRPSGPARGPESLSPLDYVSVCTGAGRAAAAPYRKGSGDRHTLLVFYRRAADTNYFQLTNLPAGWVPEPGAVSRTELVACVTPTERSKLKDCDFRSGNVLELYDTRFAVTLHEAQTGKLVAQASLDVKADPECPMIKSFEKPRQIEDADPRQALVEFARPHVEP